MPLEKLLTVDEAASVLNTTPRFVRRLITERLGVGARLPSNWCVGRQL